MFLHMEFFSLLCSVAAGSRGHLGGWGALLSCIHSVLEAVGSKTGPSSFCPDVQQSPHFAWCTDPFAHGFWTHSAMAFFLQLRRLPVFLISVLLAAARQTLPCPSALHICSLPSRKKPSPCSFCLLNWGKEQRPRPKARTFIGSVAVVQAYCGRAQILSPPHRVTWEYHYNSARFRQQYFLSVLALENLLLLDTHQVVNGKFGSRCGKIYKHILAIFLLLPGSWDLITDLEKGLHFPLTRAQSPGLLVLSSRLISHSCVPRNRHRECNKSTPKISLLARNILRRVICLELGAEHILAAVSSPSSCHLRLLY